MAANPTDSKRIIVAVATLVAAGLVYYFFGSSGGVDYGAVADAGGTYHLRCESCNAEFDLTSQEYATQMENRVGNDGLKCTQCGAMKAWDFKTVQAPPDIDLSGVNSIEDATFELQSVVREIDAVQKRLDSASEADKPKIEQELNELQRKRTALDALWAKFVNEQDARDAGH